LLEAVICGPSSTNVLVLLVFCARDGNNN